jgi:protein subunit release factor A
MILSYREIEENVIVAGFRMQNMRLTHLPTGLSVSSDVKYGYHKTRQKLMIELEKLVSANPS